MKKIVSLFVVLATLVLTGCDAKWTGGVDPTPPPLVNPLPVPPTPSPCVTPDRPCDQGALPPGTVPGTVTNPPHSNNHEVHRPLGTNSARKVGRIFTLPSRYYPGVTKKVTLMVPEDEPVETTLATLRANGDCYEDYPSQPPR